ncbi:MAG: LapA family protein [Mycobacterium sp.]|uniref:LapA family protein n=1 Tax=Mycobacterium sp. TaxID=1785 RepID=UPI001EC8C5FC|nr:LapA family protein [Mycobacterium sp.]MBV8786664.1 LapA family protein [Mycobacterium sp.]
MRHDPVGDDRITGRPANDAERMAGLAIVGAAALALVVCVATFALGHAGAGVVAASVALLAFGAGLSWLAMDRRRIRQEERDWLVSHSAR